MTPYIVRAGDYLAKIAHAAGHTEDDLWHHPENAELRQVRVDPSLLVAGDVVRIPPRSPQHRVTSGRLNTYVVEVPTVFVRIALLLGGEPLRNETCVVTGVCAEPLEQETDGDGTVHVSVPLALTAFGLSLPRLDHTCQVVVGGLEPVSTDGGQRRRLANLAYLPSPEAGDLFAALWAFQYHAGIPCSGVACEATLAKLVEVHGR